MAAHPPYRRSDHLSGKYEATWVAPRATSPASRAILRQNWLIRQSSRADAGSIGSSALSASAAAMCRQTGEPVRRASNEMHVIYHIEIRPPIVKPPLPLPLHAHARAPCADN
jgi:hypothetical protein